MDTADVLIRKDNFEKVNRLAQYATVKHIEREPSMHFMIVDRKECILVHRIPDDEDPVRGEDIAIWSNDSAIVKTIWDFALDVFNSGLNYHSYNLIRPSLTQLANWIRALDIDYKEFLKNLGEDLGDKLSHKIKAKKMDPLLIEIRDFWKEHNLGNMEVVKKKPLEIAMEYNMACNSNPEIAKAICQFVKSLMGSILTEKLGYSCTLQEVDCKPEHQTFCKFRVNLDK